MNGGARAKGNWLGSEFADNEIELNIERYFDPNDFEKPPARQLARGQKAVVCKHWIRNLCKKGDQCDFLHEYDTELMPECYFFSKFGECSNPDCVFRHVQRTEEQAECPWYKRGFCKHGPHCHNRHIKRSICWAYVEGFCPKGKECEHYHAKFDIPAHLLGTSY